MTAPELMEVSRINEDIHLDDADFQDSQDIEESVELLELDSEEDGPMPASYEALSDPFLYLNRELSWLAFNERVFGEAVRERHPLLERVKFIAIGHSNLDEYYMIRVSGLQQQVAAKVPELTPDGLT